MVRRGSTVRVRQRALQRPRSFEDVLAVADDLQRRLESCLEDSPLPERPDYEGVNGFLAYTYRAW
jgi:hypothetical protein